jgi:hypothetical protein
MTTHSPQLSALDIRLLDWLENDTDRFEKYITKHPDVADRIEQLLDGGAVLAARLNEALSVAVAAPLDLAERLTASIGRDRSTDAASVALDLFSIGAQTFNLLISPE